MGIPNQMDSSTKTIDGAKYFTDVGSKRCTTNLRTRYSKEFGLFYITHLDWELAKSESFSSAGHDS